MHLQHADSRSPRGAARAKFYMRLGLALSALVALLAASGCASQPGADTGRAGGGDSAQGGAAVIKIDGSSTVFPLVEAVAEEFQQEKGGRVKVTVGISGTGGGFKKFVRGETDISNASRPISKEEMEQARAGGVEFVELPVCFDALTIVVNPQNDWLNSVSVAELKRIWEPEAQGKLTHWNQINPAWPNEKIALFGAGSDSGTFDYFTEAVVGKAKSSRGDYTASEDDNTLVQGVAGNKFALGYLPYAYYAPNTSKLKALPVSWEKNESAGPIAPTMENVLAGTYNPLSRPLFIYVSRKSADRPEVKEFVEFFLKNAAPLAKEVKYLPLTDADYQSALGRFASRQLGSGFDGHPEIGVTVQELLSRTPKS